MPDSSEVPPTSQPVLGSLTAAVIFLVLTINPGGEAACRDVLGDWTSLERAVGFRAPGPALASIAAVGSQAWDRLFVGPRPAELHPFRELAGPGIARCPRPGTCSCTSGTSGWTCASSSRARS